MQTPPLKQESLYMEEIQPFGGGGVRVPTDSRRVPVCPDPSPPTGRLPIPMPEPLSQGCVSQSQTACAFPSASVPPRTKRRVADGEGGGVEAGSQGHVCVKSEEAAAGAGLRVGGQREAGRK